MQVITMQKFLYAFHYWFSFFKHFILFLLDEWCMQFVKIYIVTENRVEGIDPRPGNVVPTVGMQGYFQPCRV
jgi:hypothetical protein